MAWEADFLSSMSNLRGPVMDKIMWFFSMLGDGGWFLILTTIVLLIMVKTRRIGVEAAASLILTFIIGNLIIKSIVGRIRPYDAYTFLQAIVSKPIDSSFPSGHTSNSFAVAVAILLNDRKLGIPAVIVAAMIAFSRLYNVVHYPTDVIAGLILGTTAAVTVHILYNKLIRNKIVQDIRTTH